LTENSIHTVVDSDLRANINNSIFIINLENLATPKKYFQNMRTDNKCQLASISDKLLLFLYNSAA